MVTLTGGNLGGTEINDPTWNDGEVRNFDGLNYRKEGIFAIFCGAA